MTNKRTVLLFANINKAKVGKIVSDSHRGYGKSLLHMHYFLLYLAWDDTVQWIYDASNEITVENVNQHVQTIYETLVNAFMVNV